MYHICAAMRRPSKRSIAGWPERRILQVRVPKAPPRPAAAGEPSSPVRLHPTNILQGILEAAQAAEMKAGAVAAVSVVGQSPCKAKAVPKHNWPLPVLNPEMHAATAAGSSVLVLAAREH